MRAAVSSAPGHESFALRHVRPAAVSRSISSVRSWRFGPESWARSVCAENPGASRSPMLSERVRTCAAYTDASPARSAAHATAVPKPTARSRGPGRTSRRKNARRKIAIAAVAHDEYDDCVLGRFRHFERSPQRAARGDDRENAFLRGEPARHVFGVVLRDFDHAVDALPVADRWKIRLRPFAYAGDLGAFARLAA